MTTLDYYAEAIADSFQEHGITATNEQIERVARDLEVAYDNRSLAFGTPEVSHHRQEMDSLRSELKSEREKVTCRECGGRGRVYFWGPHHGSDTECSKCRGEGRHSL